MVACHKQPPQENQRSASSHTLDDDNDLRGAERTDSEDLAVTVVTQEKKNQKGKERAGPNTVSLLFILVRLKHVNS